MFLGSLSMFDFNLYDAASIGIIGGADGPTAIFLPAGFRTVSGRDCCRSIFLYGPCAHNPAAHNEASYYGKRAGD